MNLTTEPYISQSETWPETGKMILAQYDDDGMPPFFVPVLRESGLVKAYRR